MTNIFCIYRDDVGNLINKDDLPIERINGNGPSVTVGRTKANLVSESYSKYMEMCT
jgi:hypothetical protein